MLDQSLQLEPVLQRTSTQLSSRIVQVLKPHHEEDRAGTDTTTLWIPIPLDTVVNMWYLHSIQRHRGAAFQLIQLSEAAKSEARRDKAETAGTAC